MKKLKVLMVVDTMFDGGAPIVALRLAKGMDKNSFDFTFLVRVFPGGKLEEEAKKNGIEVIHQPADTRGVFKSIKYYKKLFKENNYDVVHCHSTFFNAVILKCAFACKIKKRVSHSHLTWDKETNFLRRLGKGIYKFLMQKILTFYATDIIACSKETGWTLYGKGKFEKHGIVLDNPINCKEFIFDDSISEHVRNEMGINRETVVWGHVGRLEPIKNHKFIIELLSLYKQKNNNVILLLVGDGLYRKDIEKKVAECNCNENVIFLGNRNDVNQLLMAMDIMIFPSFHEGFPISLIEAQATKLPCLISNTVTEAVKQNTNVKFESLDAPKKVWIEQIELLLSQKRKSIDTSVIVNRFGIESISKKVEEIYTTNC